jgi:hypothetical protein
MVTQKVGDEYEEGMEILRDLYAKASKDERTDVPNLSMLFFSFIRVIVNYYSFKPLSLKALIITDTELKDIAKVHSAGLVVVGTYSAAVNATFVSLKLVKTDTGQIIKGHDYALPNNADVNRLLTVK